MGAGERPLAWLTVEDVARLREVDESVVRDAIRQRRLSGVTIHPDHPWRWMVRRCDAEAWTPGVVIALPEQTAASAAEGRAART